MQQSLTDQVTAQRLVVAVLGAVCRRAFSARFPAPALAGLLLVAAAVVVTLYIARHWR